MKNIKLTIQAGASLSDYTYLYGQSLIGIVIPSSWTAASVTFQVSTNDPADSDVTFSDVYTQLGSEIVVQAAASRYVQIDPILFPSVEYLRVRSGTSGSPVNQAATREIILVTKEIQ